MMAEIHKGTWVLATGGNLFKKVCISSMLLIEVTYDRAVQKANDNVRGI